MSEGIEILHGCQFLSSLVRGLAKLPGGFRRFVPCHLGSHKSRLRHLGWNQGSHGLSSRPLEPRHHQCLKAVCGEFWSTLKGAAAELLGGTLRLRYCTAIFTTRFHPWSLPGVGNGGGKRQFGTPGHHSDPGGNLGKRASNAEEMEKIALSFLRRREGGEVGEPRNVFPRLGAG